MDEVILHLANGHPVDIHTGKDTRPCSAFLLLAHVPADPPGMILLNYGNSTATGNMLMGMYQRSVHDAPELAWILEQVARTIVEFADKERAVWPQGDRAGRA